MASDDEYNSPGAVKPAKTRKAGCGVRFEEDELREGIDFSGAADLKPSDDEDSFSDEDRKPEGQP